MNKTFVMCKPDAVERRLVGEIVSRLERKGLTLVAAELRSAPKEVAEEHYAEHGDKPFYGELVTFLTRAPVFAMVVEGPADNTFSLVRKLVGATKVAGDDPRRLRHDHHREPRPRGRQPRERRPGDRPLVPEPLTSPRP
jgi:nucleoside-diphosphate kinase